MEFWLRSFGVPVGDASSAEDADPDGDGLSNLMEYAFGLDPLSNSAGQMPTGHIEGGRFLIRFSEPDGVSGIRYSAEWSATMEPGTWRPVPDTGSGGEHLFAMPLSTSPHLFMRLKVERK